MQLHLFYTCCFTENTGDHKSKLANFTEHRGCHRLSLCMSVPCCTAAKLGPCCQPYCHRPVNFIGATHALQALSAPVKPYTERFAERLAVSERTAACTQSCASPWSRSSHKLLVRPILIRPTLVCWLASLSSRTTRRARGYFQSPARPTTLPNTSLLREGIYSLQLYRLHGRSSTSPLQVR